MGIDRRKFLKIAGLSAMMGLGGKASIDLLAPGEVEASLKGIPITQGRKWGMAVDMNKMTDEIMGRCIEACHRVHNVPDFGDPRVEIKWLWKDTYEHTFPGQGHEYLNEKFTHKNFLLL